MYSKLRSSSLSPRWKWKFFTHSFTPASPLPTPNFPLFMLHHLTCSFALVITTMATRGHHLTININMDHNKLLTQAAHTAICLGRTIHIFVCVCATCVMFIYSIFILMYYFSVDCPQKALRISPTFLFQFVFQFVVHHYSDPSLAAQCGNRTFTRYLNVLCLNFKCLF